MSERHRAWGDDPEERDADATVAELASEPERPGRWYDRRAVVPFKVVVSFVAIPDRLPVWFIGRSASFSLSLPLTLAAGMVLGPLQAAIIASTGSMDPR